MIIVIGNGSQARPARIALYPQTTWMYSVRKKNTANMAVPEISEIR